MHSSSPSSQAIDLEDFQHLQEMDERISYQSDGNYGAPPVNSLTDAFMLSSNSKLAIFIAILLVMLAHWKSTIEKWYRSLKFQLRHITLKEFLVYWWWTNIEYGRGAWYMGHELLRNTFLILRGRSEDSKRNGVYMGSLTNQNTSRASMPELLPDDQLPEVLGPTTINHETPSLDARHLNGDTRNSSQITQTIKEEQTLSEEVEPAFCQETNYPPGWLVFHSRLGVVHKGVADEYDRRRHNLVAEASRAKRIEPHGVNTLSPHDSQSSGIGSSGPTSIPAH